ncbi:PREDICTED: E3 ubiquitin-protein ligase TRIM71-like [Branchiostoma belcheri]|uniref:E3 ubiquitin-protein ligase TRIM71-like n=1 Tax=Branchiostoma belcheri TaxID=7741 RepID=A0A6P4XZD1_BRABE|nr:PREDICTED: E3 ubiquitin-protein ligase TRIM71-like [Branchiostoma belcheri]
MADRCTVHGHEELKFFCTMCDTFVCSECLLDRHNGHNMVRLTDAVVQGRNAEDKGRKVADAMARNLETLNQRGEEMERQRVDVETQITTAAARLVDNIEREKVALINQVREIYNEETRRMGECGKELESRLSDVIAALDQLQITGHSQGEAAAASSPALSKLAQLINEVKEPTLPPPTVINFEPQKNDKVSHLLGKVSTRKRAVAEEKPITTSTGAASPRQFPRTSPRAAPPNSSGFKSAKEPKSPRTHVAPKNTSTIGSGQLVSPLKIAYTSDDRVFVLDRDGGGSVKVLNMNGFAIKSFPLKLADSKKYEVGEGGLFVNGGGQVVFVGFARPLSGSLGDYMDVMCRYQEDGKLLHRVELQLSSKQAWDAAEISDGKIAVALDWMISIIDEAGQELSSFSTSVPDFCCLAYNKAAGDQLVISRFHDHFVEVYSLDGRVCFQFGAEGSGEGEFMGPLGVCVNKNGHILIADWSNRRVQMFDQKGRWLKHVATSREGLEEPRAAVQTPDGRVLVSDTKKNCVFVFTF